MLAPRLLLVCGCLFGRFCFFVFLLSLCLVFFFCFCLSAPLSTVRAFLTCPCSCSVASNPETLRAAAPGQVLFLNVFYGYVQFTFLVLNNNMKHRLWPVVLWSWQIMRFLPIRYSGILLLLTKIQLHFRCWNCDFVTILPNSTRVRNHT